MSDSNYTKEQQALLMQHMRPVALDEDRIQQTLAKSRQSRRAARTRRWSMVAAAAVLVASAGFGAAGFWSWDGTNVEDLNHDQISARAALTEVVDPEMVGTVGGTRWMEAKKVIKVLSDQGLLDAGVRLRLLIELSESVDPISREVPIGFDAALSRIGRRSPVNAEDKKMVIEGLIAFIHSIRALEGWKNNHGPNGARDDALARLKSQIYTSRW